MAILKFKGLKKNLDSYGILLGIYNMISLHKDELISFSNWVGNISSEPVLQDVTDLLIKYGI